MYSTTHNFIFRILKKEKLIKYIKKIKQVEAGESPHAGEPPHEARVLRRPLELLPSLTPLLSPQFYLARRLVDML